MGITLLRITLIYNRHSFIKGTFPHDKPSLSQRRY